MGKYLIQDIVPADKKHRTAKKHAGVEAAAPVHHHRAVHHDEQPAHHHTRIHAPDSHPSISRFGEDLAHLEQLDKPEIEHEEAPRTDAIMSAPLGAPFVANTASFVESSRAWNTTGGSEGEQQIPDKGAMPPRDSRPHFEAGNDDTEGRRTNWLPWTLIPLMALAVLGLILNFFSGAVVSIIPKTDSMPIELTLSALKSATGDELPFAVMKVEESVSSEVLATGTKTVTTKASGRIIIYNEQLTAQRLIKNTRFESPTGKIYRINESITVPKKTGTTIGKLEVTVYADEAGAAYNTEPTDFTVPGLKNTPQATKVYARGKGAIEGGASGTIKTVADEDLKQAQNDLRIALETRLRSRARGNLSPAHIAYDPGIIVDIKEPALSNDKATSEERAVVTANGSLYVVVFDRKQLIKAVAKAALPTYDGEEIAIDNLDSLTFGMANMTADALWKAETLEFTISGTPLLRWAINETMIKDELLGLAKADFNAKMAKYGTIERAKASLRPFWKTSFPSDPEKITIKIVDAIDE